MPEDDPQPARGGGASSATAYRNINRQLSTFYEPPAEDEEKEELKRQVAELTERLQRQQTATPTAGRPACPAGEVLRACRQVRWRWAGGASACNGRHRKEAGCGVGAVSTGKRRFRAATAHERCRLYPGVQPATQLRLQTRPVGTGYAAGRNTIAACIHQDQTLIDGQSVKLRLLEPMQAGNIIVPKNTVLSGAAKVQGETARHHRFFH